jgi:uncharacterized glyoxalase superfamily protein PhnB
MVFQARCEGERAHFRTAGSRLGEHPTGGHGASHNTPAISLYTEDNEATVNELKAKGVECSTPVEDQGIGLVTFSQGAG